MACRAENISYQAFAEQFRQAQAYWGLGLTFERSWVPPRVSQHTLGCEAKSVSSVSVWCAQQVLRRCSKDSHLAGYLFCEWKHSLFLKE